MPSRLEAENRSATNNNTSIFGVKAVTEYRDIPGFPGYMAGSDGSIWSRWKMQGRGRGWAITSERRRRLKANPANPGVQGADHLYVRINVNGKKHSKKVHQLVLFAFVGPRPDGLECRHKDGITHNNDLTNLEWATKLVNQADTAKHGTRAWGEKNGKTKFGEKEVLEILKLREEGKTHSEIGVIIGCPKTTVCGILLGRNWSHFTGIVYAGKRKQKTRP